jgi:hypothetical protein
LASHSMCALLRARSIATNLSSHTIRAFSRLSSYLSHTRSYSYNLVTITGTATASKRGALNQSVGRDPRHGEQQHKVRTHLNNGDAQLEETSTLAR